MAPRVSIRDVATRAGVSPTTVSHVLNRTPGTRTSATTQERVRRAATELGYSANAVARTLRTRRSNSVGFVGDEIATTPYAGQLIAGAQEVVRTHDGVLLVTNTEYDADLEAREVRELLDREVDGVLYAAMYHRLVRVPEALDGVPVVVLNAEAVGGTHSWVTPDEVAGGLDAAEALLGAGHRRLAMLNNADDIPAAKGRPEGFLAACRQAGLPGADVSVIVSEQTYDAAHRAALDVLGRPDRPTGLFCFNDRMAMGAYRAAHELGLRIGRDVSVVGFDDMQIITEAVDPPLTSVALPHRAMGAWAAEQLYLQISALDEGHEPEPRSVRLRGPVVHRASVGTPPRE
ncbi:LacI family DNA-binding transcriptional regulator [Cellulomonas hominis]|uniref:LacI family DNA-binding transcriptional regulator n=1 Tax=Cellulomonas hominis TaxID=156981 RepID=UPI001B924C4A|nr:LacI family DNA-binding transcriptional regulator [Cellulomonas hominis]VTR75787.1 HTH-type transcriptional regulator DegA [Cellulomonas hominis]